MNTQFKMKRIYEEPSASDGYRILIDRFWPRGVKKEEARLDEWLKEIAPSDSLRRWFDHKKERFEEFTKLYEQELAEKKKDLEHILEIAEAKDITFVYASRETEINHARVLINYLKTMK